ncbi:hypothetical protein CNEO4_220001 [Clostridium neonatale]|nr:hypothetical protein CNEO4_220001 [Clostridium neonatale]
MKVSRTVWNGGKTGDCFKGLPIIITYSLRETNDCPLSFD